MIIVIIIIIVVVVMHVHAATEHDVCTLLCFKCYISVGKGRGTGKIENAHHFVLSF